MNIAEALKIAKEQGKGVRPVWADKNVQIKYWDFGKLAICDINGVFKAFFTLNLTTDYDFNNYILKDWEVVKEKPSKQTQYKIDSMKFQIVRYCGNQKRCSTCKLFGNCINSKNELIAPILCKLDDWSLKEIVEAYHILKEAGEI